MPPLPTFDIDQSIEALIEGSEMSQLVEGERILWIET